MLHWLANKMGICSSWKLCASLSGRCLAASLNMQHRVGKSWWLLGSRVMWQHPENVAVVKSGDAWLAICFLK